MRVRVYSVGDNVVIVNTVFAKVQIFTPTICLRAEAALEPNGQVLHCANTFAKLVRER